MEVLLTLESVVDNLAECLKNNDLMAILTRFVSSLCVYFCLVNVLLYRSKHLIFHRLIYWGFCFVLFFVFIPELHLQIS